MTIVSSINNFCSTDGVASFALKETLKSAGWVVKSSSDATTYNSTGDQITSSGSGANGMFNNNAWFRIQDPIGRREFTFQKGSTAGAYRVKYSASSKFTGGSPAAAVTPSATDERVLFGAGTDASPTFANFFSSVAASYYYNIMAENESDSGNSVFGFWSFISTMGSTPGSTFFLEPLAYGSYSQADQDPCILFTSASTLNNLAATTISVTGVFAWYRYNLSNSSFVNFNGFIPSILSASSYAVSRSGLNPYDQSVQGFPILYGREASALVQIGVKGYGKYVKWNASPRTFPEIVKVGSSVYVCINELLVPWPTTGIPSF